MHLERAICSDPRLLKMRWTGGLRMISVVIEDARGGQGLPGIGMTEGPAKLVLEALGAKVTIASPPEMDNKDGFAAACSTPGVNSVRHLREHLLKLSGHLEEHERRGDDGLKWVDNLHEKRLVLRQVGEILNECDWRFSPALGGSWIAVFHHPKVGRNPNVWRTGSATPTIEFRVLMRGARLDKANGVTAVEDAAYAARASEARVQAEAEAEATAGGAEDGEDEDTNQIRTADDYIRALGERIYDGQVREVVTGAVNDVVQTVMERNGNRSEKMDALVWKAAESKKQRLMPRGPDNPMHRKFSI